MTNAETSSEKFSLEIPSPEESREKIENQITLSDERLSSISEFAVKQGNAIIDADIDSAEGRMAIISAVDSLGKDAVRKSTSKNSMLSKRMVTIGADGGESGEVASSIEELAIKMRDLDPSGLDFAKHGILGRFMDPVRRYFEKYKTADAEIADIVKSLQNGRRTLSDDNKTLQFEEQDMRDLTKKLNESISTAMDLDTYLTSRTDELAMERGEDDEQVKFIREEVIFPLRQKTADLQSQLAVNQQGLIAMDVLRRNNEELIRSVDRAQTTTVSALRVAVTLAGALYDQRIVMEKVDTLNSATNKMIANTSKMLKQQGSEIQRQASETGVSVETMKQAFNDTFDALDEISSYKQAALPKLKEQIDAFKELADEGEKRIRRIEATGAFD